MFLTGTLNYTMLWTNSESKTKIVPGTVKLEFSKNGGKATAEANAKRSKHRRVEGREDEAQTPRMRSSGCSREREQSR